MPEFMSYLPVLAEGALTVAALLVFLVAALKAIMFAVDKIMSLWQPESWLGKKAKSFTAGFLKLCVAIPGFPMVPALMGYSYVANASGVM